MSDVMEMAERLEAIAGCVRVYRDDLRRMGPKLGERGVDAYRAHLDMTAQNLATGYREIMALATALRTS